jgi:steroid delta-isomerase-like uncharacterized protein
LPIERQPVVSSDIASVGYDNATQTLEIEFKATGVYRYFSVPANVAAELRATPSPGKYFLQRIKGKYAWEKSAERITDNREIVRQYVAAFNRGDDEVLRGLFTPDAVIQGVLGQGGMDKVIAVWREIRDAFAIELIIEEIIAEGDVVAVRYTERGKSAGPFRGQAPTGKPYEIVAMEWFQIRDGRIHRRWGARDSADQFREMGLTFP